MEAHEDPDLCPSRPSKRWERTVAHEFAAKYTQLMLHMGRPGRLLVCGGAEA